MLEGVASGKWRCLVLKLVDSPESFGFRLQVFKAGGLGCRVSNLEFQLEAG